jgi:hypothetical protein
MWASGASLPVSAGLKWERSGRPILEDAGRKGSVRPLAHAKEPYCRCTF